jgi:hypothetical protein
MPMDCGENAVGSQALLEGKYANYFEIGYNAREFLLDFGQKYAGGDEGRMHARIITGPMYAKELLRVLAKSIADYERAFGPLQDED